MVKTSLGRTFSRHIIDGALVILLAVAGWEFLYYGPYDQKDLRYQCWKLGLYPLKIDAALETMVDDSRRDTLVLGKTQEQLVSKFGYVSSIAGADNYVKYCYENSQYRGTPVLFLRNSHWMVSMANGRASDLRFVKGC